MMSLGREPQVRDHPKTVSPRGATELACGVSRRISAVPICIKPRQAPEKAAERRYIFSLGREPQDFSGQKKN